MKAFIAFSVLIVATNAAVLRELIPIRSYLHEIHDDGVYNIKTETGNGIVFSESGSLVLPPGSKEHGAAKTGSYSFTTPEGEVVTTNYVADHLGFRVTGSHLPVPPPVPAEIREVLPTLPKLVEERPIRVVEPVIARRPVTTTFVEERTVETPEFFVNAAPAHTVVRIGQ